jgi:hypothetical protein
MIFAFIQYLFKTFHLIKDLSQRRNGRKGGWKKFLLKWVKSSEKGA